MEKFKLFRDTNIKVYWLDPISKEEKSGILWNYSWLVGVMSSNPDKDKVVDAGFYTWDVKGDDGLFYTFSETELYLDRHSNIN